MGDRASNVKETENETGTPRRNDWASLGQPDGRAETEMGKSTEIQALES